MKANIPKPEKKKTEIEMGTLYDFNKAAMLQEPILTIEEIENKKKELENWFNWIIDGYAMLLCKERVDYTLFHLYEKQNPNPPKIAADELIAALQNRGVIISIDKHNILSEDEHNTSWEIWINIDNEAFVYYLFQADSMVIEC